MKIYRLLLMLACCCLMSSCFKDEPLNAECDIESAYVHVGSPLETFFNITDTLVDVPYTDSTVTFSVRRHTDITAMSPYFNITEGATINPASGSTHDFSNGGVRYTVTSQDGAWHRAYNVKFNAVTKKVADTVEYDFEHYELDTQYKKYYVWHDVLEDGSLGNDWATGNPGFKLSMSTAKPEDYPSAPISGGYDGAAVCLTTRSTGPFGELVNRRIAAGNLFLGTFDLAPALTETMKCTKFGIPFDEKPVKFSGYYKYTPGTDFQDENGKIIAGKIDSASVYAVFYRNHDADGNAVTLDGYNVKTSDLIVAMADTKSLKTTSDWTPFEATFVFTEDIDEKLLENRGYSLAIVFSSSNDGDKFKGAIGSQLMIDKVRVVCTEEK